VNVNITGIYENTIFEHSQLLQTDLSSLANVVNGLPFQYANLTSFTILSNDYETFKINNNSNLSNLNNDIDDISSSLSILSCDYESCKLHQILI
jgi:hypothetical protein